MYAQKLRQSGVGRGRGEFGGVYVYYLDTVTFWSIYVYFSVLTIDGYVIHIHMYIYIHTKLKCCLPMRDY